MCDNNNSLKSQSYCNMLQYYRNLVNNYGVAEANILFEREMKKFCSQMITQEYCVICKENELLEEGIHYLEDYGYDSNAHDASLNSSILKFKNLKNLTYIRPHIESGKIKLIRDAFEDENNVPPLENSL